MAGLPLLHVEAPTFSGPRLVLKSTIDWVGALLLTLLFSPLLLVVEVLVKLSDGGPVFFRQVRVGLHGETFRMVQAAPLATVLREMGVLVASVIDVPRSVKCRSWTSPAR